VKLNPEKCVFGVPRGMLLGYIVSQRGIEANPEKVTALERMGPIRDLKGVQRVLGCLAALSRFISRLGEKGLPLYRLLKKHERFSWTAEAQEALDKLKACLTHAPILTPPQDGEPLYLYVAATTQVVSAVIVAERTEEGHALPVQRPVYYISEVLSDTKTRYPQVRKLLYAVVLARRKLRHYFEAHPVTVVSSFPLGEIIRNPDAAGRIAKWSVELMGETLAYAPRNAIKSQILADFVAEWTDTQLPSPQIQAECWTLYFSAVEHAGTGLRHACHCTPYGSPSTASSSPRGDAPVNHCAFTLEAAPVQVQDTPRRHDQGQVRQDNRQLLGPVRHTSTRS
jgi:hypothetical protein